MLGRPRRADPVWTNNWAGAWLNWSVYIERTIAMSSATVARCGRMSDITWPDSPARRESVRRAEQLGLALDERELLAADVRIGAELAVQAR